ncbi:MAG: hypothetical protein JXA93_18910 [Anaerolineae bacterium]|nr:hypothetical protein [Anaerolineae bacterium]
MNIVDLVEAIRENHAVEHATMHVLGGRYPQARLVGRSTAAGFYIYGEVDTHALANAASEGLIRLQQGEDHLAVHPRCGTNLVITSLMAGGAAFLASVSNRPRSRLDRLPLALAGATLAAIVAQPLAHRIQEEVTTSPEVDNLYITGVERQERGRMVVHKVRIGRS